MENKQFDKNVLNHLFDPSIKDKIATHLQPVKVLNDNDHLIGYAEIFEVEAINIDEISFGNKLIETSNLIERAMTIAKENIDLKHIKKNLSLDFNKAFTEINSSYNLSEILNIGNLLSKEIDSLTSWSAEINNNIEQLKSALPKLKSVIDSNTNSDDPRVQSRVNMLQQFYTFQQLRIKTIESNLEISKSTLTNCSNFITFTLPNLSYTLQTSLYNADLKNTLLNYEDLIKNEISLMWEKNILNLSLAILVLGFSISMFLYSLFSLTGNYKMVTGSFGWIGTIGTLFSFVFFLKTRQSEIGEIILSFFILSAFLGGVIISFLDATFYDLLIVQNLSVSLSMGAILFLGASLLIAYILKTKIKPCQELFVKCQPLVEKLSLMEKQYEKNRGN